MLSNLKNTSRLLLLAVLMFSTMGATQCSAPNYNFAFKTVTVPASDTTRPSIINSVYDYNTGVYEPWATNDAVINYVSGYTSARYLVATGHDAGGVKSLSVEFTERVKCCRAGLCNQAALAQYFAYSDAQAGSTGSRVSDGIWLTRAFQPQEIISRRCGSNGDSSSKVQVTWYTAATDFKNNTRYSPTQYARYNW